MARRSRYTGAVEQSDFHLSSIPEVAPGIYRITTPLPFRPREVHAYLVSLPADTWLLVDGGADLPDAWVPLDAGVREIAGDWSGVTNHVVTHMHLDHIGLTYRVREASRPRLLTGKLDGERSAHAAENPGEEAEYRRQLLTSAGAPAELTDSLAEAIGRRAAESPFIPADVLLPISTTPLPDIPGWQSVWTPGHTAGHIGLFREEDRVFIGGDAVLPRVTATIGVNRQRADPVADFHQTLDTLDALNPGVILPGHGEPIEDPHARIAELRADTRSETARIGELITAEPSTAWQLTRMRYPDRELPPPLWFLALRETLAHLDHLAISGTITGSRDNAGVHQFARIGD